MQSAAYFIHLHRVYFYITMSYIVRRESIVYKDADVNLIIFIELMIKVLFRFTGFQQVAG